jgi:hypothetical protein
MTFKFSTSVLLILFFFPIYIYFFQGGGWSQNSHFDLVRAMAEHGTTEITDYATNTGDVSTIDTKVFSNKPPGFALLAVSPYWIALQVEKLLNLDYNKLPVVNFNAHLLSALLSALPTLFILILLCRYFASIGLRKKDSLGLSLIFGFAGLCLPYSGTFMPHNLVAFLLFYACLMLANPTMRTSSAYLAGGALGLMVLVDYSSAPLGILSILLGLIRASSPRSRIALIVGPITCLLLLLFYHYISFGTPWTFSYQHTSAQFLNSDLFLGLFGIPRLERIYFLTIHPMKGLFFLSPVMISGLVGLCLSLRYGERSFMEKVAPIVICYYVLLAISMETGTGGWGVGVRYCIPALPFLYCFAGPVWTRFRIAFVALAVYSGLLIFSVTAVDSLMPAPLTWPTMNEVVATNPISWSSRWLSQGMVSVNTLSMLEKVPSDKNPSSEENYWDSYNLGELIGLRGLASLLPILFWILLVGPILTLKFSRSWA